MLAFQINQNVYNKNIITQILHQRFYFIVADWLTILVQQQPLQGKLDRVWFPNIDF
jgi:hypothetical protein